MQHNWCRRDMDLFYCYVLKLQVSRSNPLWSHYTKTCNQDILSVARRSISPYKIIRAPITAHTAVMIIAHRTPKVLIKIPKTIGANAAPIKKPICNQPKIFTGLTDRSRIAAATNKPFQPKRPITVTNEPSKKRLGTWNEIKTSPSIPKSIIPMTKRTLMSGRWSAMNPATILINAARPLIAKGDSSTCPVQFYC